MLFITVAAIAFVLMPFVESVPLTPVPWTPILGVPVKIEITRSSLPSVMLPLLRQETEMEEGLPTPEASLDSLKHKVTDAKLRFDFPSPYAKEVERDDRSGRYPEDRDRAIRAQHSAHDEYLRVLKIYEDFVARGQPAPDGAGSQPDSTMDGEEP